MSPPLATVGILSIGDMGAGIARLLIANGYRVITNVEERSQATKTRAQNLSIDLLPTDSQLYNTADYILSIVPPRDALATAKRIVQASTASQQPSRSQPLYYLDLNAVSPATARTINDLFASSAPSIRLIDGGIIGGPPTLHDDGTWYTPSIPVSGPHELALAEPSGKHLRDTLNMKHLDNSIGSASGLKMCFAAIQKGLTGLVVQSFTTAKNLGVLPELQEQLRIFDPHRAQAMERALTIMPPKAYRWVREMEEIAETFEVDGGFAEGESSFRSLAQVYRLIADGTELGRERTEERVRGRTAEDVAELVGEGTRNRIG